MKRYFEFIGSDGKTDIDHSKFWEIWVDGTTLRSRYGKIGANGQTTLKSFDSASDAETALTKAVAEKVKKGYIEKNNADSEEQSSAPVPEDKFADDPDVIAERVNYKKWAKKFKPVAKIAFDLEELPEGISEEFIWSEHAGDQENYLSCGFTPSSFSRRLPSIAFVVTSVASTSKNSDDFINTEGTIYCDECDGIGDIDDEPCANCDGDGRFYIDYTERYPLVIETPEELAAFTRAKNNVPEKPQAGSSTTAVKFCSECGTKREPVTAKFCADCGHAFG